MKDDPERTPDADKGVEAERLWRKKKGGLGSFSV